MAQRLPSDCSSAGDGRTALGPCGVAEGKTAPTSSLQERAYKGVMVQFGFPQAKNRLLRMICTYCLQAWITIRTVPEAHLGWRMTRRDSWLLLVIASRPSRQPKM